MNDQCSAQMGRVSAVYPDRVVVTFLQKSACSGCHASSACTMMDQKRREVTVFNPEGLYEVGDSVVVKVNNSVGTKAILLSFVLPLAVLLTVSLLCIQVFALGEVASIGISLAALGLYYFILSRFSSVLKQKMVLTIEKTFKQ